MSDQIKDEEHLKALLLLQINVHEKTGQFELATTELSRYQLVTHYQDSALTQTLLQRYWLKHRFSELKTILKKKEACPSEIKDICHFYEMIQPLVEKVAFSEHDLFQRAVHGSKTIAALWAIAALEHPKKVPFQDRLIFLNRIAATWENIDPLVQVQFLPLLQERLILTLQSIRTAAPEIAPLKSPKNSLEKRIQLTVDVDQTFSKVVRLPWSKVKRATVQELMLLYQRLIADLKKAQLPEKTLSPFELKVTELHQIFTELQASEMTFPAESLLSIEFSKLMPEELQNEWKEAVAEKRIEYLFYLAEKINPTNTLLKGVVLLMCDAPNEAYPLIKDAPDTPLKTQILNQFEKTRS